MKVMNIRWVQAITSLVFLTALAILTGSGSVYAEESDFDEVVAELSTKLELDEGQSNKLGSSIKAYTTKLDELFSQQEAEDADPSLLINGVRDAQADFEKSLASFMTKDQFSKYLDMKEQAIKGMLTDLAAIQLIDAQAKTTITDDQVDQLAPVLGNALHSIMKIAFENAGKNLRPRQKISLARNLKSIQSNLQKEFAKVLTPEQQQAWEAHKAENSG